MVRELTPRNVKSVARKALPLQAGEGSTQAGRDPAGLVAGVALGRRFLVFAMRPCLKQLSISSLALPGLSYTWKFCSVHSQAPLDAHIVRDQVVTNLAVQLGGAVEVAQAFLEMNGSRKKGERR